MSNSLYSAPQKGFEMLHRICTISLVVVLVALSACAPNFEAAQKIVGRWQRVSLAGPGDPNELSNEYIEFWADGTLLTLAKEETATEIKFWLIGSAAYSVTGAEQIEVEGTCWRGWEHYACTKTFQLNLKDNHMTITGDTLVGEY